MPLDDPDRVASMQREVRSIPLVFRKCYERFFKRDSGDTKKWKAAGG
jgi:hypothetical protein